MKEEADEMEELDVTLLVASTIEMSGTTSTEEQETHDWDLTHLENRDPSSTKFVNWNRSYIKKIEIDKKAQVAVKFTVSKLILETMTSSIPT